MSRPYAGIVSLMVLFSFAVLPTIAGDAELDGVLSRFRGYHLLNLQERSPDVKTFFAQHFPKDNPSVIRADFNGDGNPDYALLLKNDRAGEAKLVVLLCSTDAQCRNVYELDETAYADSVYLRPVGPRSKVPPSKALKGSPQPRKLRTAIQVNYFEKGAVVLRWNGKLQKIEEVQTAD